MPKTEASTTTSDLLKTVSSIKKNKIIEISVFGLLCAVFLFTFRGSFEAMYAHGITWHILILPITLLLIWSTPPDHFHRFNPSFKSSIPGVFLIIAALFLLFAGDVTSTLFISELALIFGVWGGVIYFGGFSLFYALILPMCYLFFISSFWEGFFQLFTPFFRHSSTILATMLCKLTGLSILRSGTYIRLPSMILNVAEECSGINHLISIFAMAVPLAAVQRLRFRNAIILIILTIPIAILSNSIRIFLIILFNYNKEHFTHGPNNILVTSAGFYIGLLFLLINSIIISRLSRQQQKTKHSESLSIRKHRFSIHIPLLKQLYLILLLLSGALVLSLSTIKEHSFPPNYYKTSTSLESWEGNSAATIPGLDSLPEADFESRILFRNSKTSDSLYVYTGFYNKQTKNKEVSGYLYDKHFQEIKKSVLVKNNNEKIKVRICNSSKDNNQFIYLITYFTFNKFTAEPVATKLYALLDAIFHRSTAASIIIIALPDNKPDTEFITASAKEFAGEFIPVINRHFINQNHYQDSPK